jgi:hypothetical protein
MQLGSLQPFLWLENNRFLAQEGDVIGTATVLPQKVVLQPWFLGNIADRDVVIGDRSDGDSRYLSIEHSLFALAPDGLPFRVGELPCKPERILTWGHFVSVLCPITHVNGRMQILTFELDQK